MSRKELEQRLTVEPARDADVITITVLDATRPQAGALAERVARAYRESVAKQAAAAARQGVAALDRRQGQLAQEIADLDRQLTGNPGTRGCWPAGRLSRLSSTTSPTSPRRPATRPARAASRAETVKESATVPDDPAQPKPLRNAVLGAMLGLVVSAGLAWWLNGRRMQNLRLLESLRAAGRGEARPELTAKGALAPARRFRRDSRRSR